LIAAFPSAMRMNLDMAGVDHQQFEIRFINQRFEQSFPYSLVAPAAKSPVRILPISIRRRQIAPWRSSPQNPENRVDELAIVFRVASPCSFSSWQVGGQPFPCFV